MVSLVRQPDNRYDPNAVRVDNVSGVQVGHIKRELAKPLASVMDRRLARVEGSANLSLPCEAKNLHHFIFTISLSKLRLLRQFLSHIYFSKFPITCVLHILYIIRDGELA